MRDATTPVPREDDENVLLRERILAWFDANRRDLPMRAEGVPPWGTLVGEVMSQQTPMPRVQPIWARWMRLWPTPTDLAAASPAQVLVEWGSLGYPSRALRLRECAIAISERPGGRVPANYEELLSLPGIGPYTASALVSFQFHGRIAVLDTNIRRVLVRTLLGLERPSSSAPTAAERALADSLLPLDGAACAKWNVAIMEFGALRCVQRAPACEDCPLADSCRWLAAGRPASQRPGRTQAWAGTDRQARGRVIALLRSLHAEVDGSRAFHARSPSARASHSSAESITSAEHGGPSTDEGGAAASSSAIPEAPVSVSRAEALEAATLPGAEPDQAPRVLAALLADGLVVETPDGRIALPTA